VGSPAGQRQHCACGLSGDRHDADAASGHADTGLECVQAVAKAAHVVGVLGLWQHDTGQTGHHDGGQVLQCQAAVQRVDADVQLGGKRGGLASDVLCRGHARLGFARRGDGVLEVEDERIGAAAFGLGELALAVGGHEKHGTQSHVRPS